jgi:LysM repeat protein
MNGITKGALVAALLLPASAVAQTGPSPCGSTATVERNDTLSRIAERCDVPERRLIRANPTVEGSRDLRVGMKLQLGSDDGGASRALDSLGSLAGEAADALAGVARDAQSTVNDILEKNPDLRQRLERFGATVTPDRPAAPAAPSVAVTPMRTSGGETLTVSATGLPKDSQILIGVGAPQAAYEVVERVRSGSDGEARVDLRVPDWAADLNRIVVTVTDEAQSWKVRSGAIMVTGTRL